MPPRPRKAAGEAREGRFGFTFILGGVGMTWGVGAARGTPTSPPCIIGMFGCGMGIPPFSCICCLVSRKQDIRKFFDSKKTER